MSPALGITWLRVCQAGRGPKLLLILSDSHLMTWSSWPLRASVSLEGCLDGQPPPGKDVCLWGKGGSWLQDLGRCLTLVCSSLKDAGNF